MLMLVAGGIFAYHTVSTSPSPGKQERMRMIRKRILEKRKAREKLRADTSNSHHLYHFFKINFEKTTLFFLAF